MTGIRMFLTNRLTWVTVAFVIVFVLATRGASVSTVAETVRTITTTLALIGLIGYGGIAVKAYKAHRWPNEPLLAALATCLIMAGLGFGGLFQILWRLSDFETYVVTNDVYSFTVALIGAGILILVTTPNLVGRGVPAWTRARLTVAWLMAAAFVIGLAVFSPDLRWLALILKPWLINAPA